MSMQHFAAGIDAKARRPRRLHRLTWLQPEGRLFLHVFSHRTHPYRFDPAAARAAISHTDAWSIPERRLLPVVVLAFLAWITQPWLEGLFPKGGLTDGTIAAAAGLVLFILPDGTGRKMLNWHEANRAPWDVVLMFGGGLAMAMGMTESGLAAWLGQMLLPLANVPLPIVALALVAVAVAAAAALR